MNNRSPGGLQDDEALLTYLTGGKEPLRWQLVYTRFRAAQAGELDNVHFSTAFATWLDDLRDGHFGKPLQHSLYATFSAYLNQTDNEQTSPYLAGNVLTLAMSKDQQNTHNALMKSYREPASAIINQRQKITEADFADAYQNAQLDLLRKPPSAEQSLTAQLFSWFMRVLIRRVIDEQRKKAKTTDFVDPEDVSFSSANNTTSANDTAYWDDLNRRYHINQRFGDDEADKVISKSLNQLDEGCRDLIRKRYVFEYAYKKIAQQNEYSVDSVGQRIKRCLKKLRRILTGNNG